jgi:hypothetical protein
MKLLREYIDTESFLVTEDKNSKGIYIAGPFMQSEIQNRNGRIYPKKILESQVNAYQSAIKGKSACGEMNHPDSVNINPERISHLVTELKMDGDNVVGKAKILESLPMGAIAANLLREGVKLGVSSRGIGSLKESQGKKIVQEDFQLMAIDIVFTPSGPDCYVNPVMESLMEEADWMWNGKIWVEEKVSRIKKDLERSALEEDLINAFQKLMKDI